MLNTMPFRMLFNFVRNTLKETEALGLSTGNLDRRTENLAKAYYALEMLDSRTLEENPELPLLIFYLRDFVAWVLHELPKKALRVPQMPEYTETRKRLLVECHETLDSVGIQSIDQQPDWREEAYKLYKSHQEEGAGMLNLNKAGETYLHTRYTDEE